MGKLRPFVRKDSYMPNKKWIPFVIGNGYTTTDGASGPAPEYETVTGNPVSFNAITPFPLKQLQIAFSPVQDLHGYDSPWPAGGGKNLLDPSKATIDLPEQVGVTVTKDGDYYRLQGTPTVTGSYRAFTLGTYADYSLSGRSLYVQFFDASVSGIIRIAYGFRTDTEKIFGVTANVTEGTPIDVRFRISVSETQQTAWTPYSNICPISGWDGVDIFLQSAYDPTAQPSISISFGSTVYSGTLDVLTGVVTDKAPSMITLDGTGWSAGTISGKLTFRHTRPSSLPNGAGFLSNYITRVSSIGSSTPPNSAYAGSTYFNVYCPDLTLEQWTELLNTTPLQLLYLASSHDYVERQLTPEQLSSLAGENVMWTDGDSLTVEYRSN